ncbi:MAG: type II toxin-antitoxin system RelE/ParE family toxin [Dehalococcoidia bacterium]|nr:type II toxin-antitoxin system RelE/ParE family toxin [Dehalococcoidia bacterium]
MRGSIWDGQALLELVELSRTDSRQARRIVEAVVRLGESRQGDFKKLQGSSGRWRLRVGNWRVIFVFEESVAVRVIQLVQRRDAYD